MFFWSNKNQAQFSKPDCLFCIHEILPIDTIFTHFFMCSLIRLLCLTSAFNNNQDGFNSDNFSINGFRIFHVQGGLVINKSPTQLFISKTSCFLMLGFCGSMSKAKTQSKPKLYK